MAKKLRVLCIDDSALVRKILAAGLAEDPGIEVVATACDPYQARDLIVTHKPDVLTLDVEMPRMDGVEFLRRLMPQHPIPVVMVSALTRRGQEITMEALAAGAVDFVTKPTDGVQNGLRSMMVELRTKVKIAATANVSAFKGRPVPIPTDGKAPPRSLAESTDKVIVIGASTGGTEAIKAVIYNLPPTSPGIVIVQHMPPGFTKLYAERLHQESRFIVKEAADNDRVVSGRVLIAPGDLQLSIVRSGGLYLVRCKPGPKVCGHCPSVEVLMQSAAEHVGRNAIGVMLTGMGGDGAQGMAALRRAGARTIAQDEATCVVFGMPREAHKAGGVEELVPLPQIAGKIQALLKSPSRAA